MLSAARNTLIDEPGVALLLIQETWDNRKLYRSLEALERIRDFLDRNFEEKWGLSGWCREEREVRNRFCCFVLSGFTPLTH
jgi:hypothetical protein